MIIGKNIHNNAQVRIMLIYKSFRQQLMKTIWIIINQNFKSLRQP